MRRLWLIGIFILLGAAALIATFGLGGLRASAERADAERWRVHTYKTIVDTKSLSIALREMQRGQRGFLLTDDPAYLEPYESGRRDSRIFLAAVASSTRDNPSQRARLAELTAARESLIEELASTIALATTGRKTDALELVKAGDGRANMLRINALLRQLVAAENQILLKREATAVEADRRVQRSTLILTILGAGLLIAAALLAMTALRTNLKRAEIDALLRTVLQSIQGAVFAKDAGGRYTLMSEVGARLFGRPIEAILGRTDAELRPPLFAAQVAEHDAQAVSAGGPVSFDEAVEVDSTTLMLRTTRTPLHDINGAVVGIAGVALDVTARQRAEAALSEAVAEASAVFELAAVGIAQIDPESGKFVKVNAKLSEISGYSAAELLDMQIFDLDHPDEIEACRQMYRRLLTGDGPQRIEKRCLHKDGSVTWINANFVLARAAGGEALRAVVLIEEVMTRRRTEEELAKTAALLRAIIEATPGLIYA